MTERTIIFYPDDRLREIAKAVTQFDASLNDLANEMLSIMYQAQGIGLAATQLGITQRIFVMDISEDHTQPMIFINPKITEKNGSIKYQEGCLSIPDVRDYVTRAQSIVVAYKDIHGKEMSAPAEDLMAVCIQHELDHLNGILFLDHLSPMKQRRWNKKIEKIHKLS